MKITLRRKYSTYQPGDVVDCEDLIAAMLIEDGTAEGDAPAAVVETAAISHDAETADLTPRRIAKPVKDK